MTRRKPTTNRQPSGAIRRQPDGPSPTEVVRLRDAALSGLRDPVWATSLGRLYITGNITSSQFAAGCRWAELVELYAAACLSPRQPRSAKLERGDGISTDPDSHPGRKEARKHVQTVEAYLAATEIFKRTSDGRILRDVVERDLYPESLPQMNMLRGVLSALAVFWGERK